MYQYGNVAVEYQKHSPRLKKDAIHPAPKRKVRAEVEEKSKTNIAARRHAISTWEKLLYLLFVGVVIVALTAILMISAQISEMNYEVHRVAGEATALHESNEIMQLEVIDLSSPERIMDIAMNELGMVMKDSSVRIMSR